MQKLVCAGIWWACPFSLCRCTLCYPDCHPEPNNDGYAYFYTNTDKYSHFHANTNLYNHADLHFHPDEYGYFYTNAYFHIHPNKYGYVYSDGDLYIYTNKYSYLHANVNQYSNLYTDIHANINQHFDLYAKQFPNTAFPAYINLSGRESPKPNLYT